MSGSGGHRGEGAVLGVRVLRYSGVQGVALAAASLLHLVTIFAVAHYLGAAELGRFALLYFAANLLSQVLTILVKPGTIRRTFAEGDDEDDEDDDDDVSDSPKRSLGTGILMAIALASVGAGAAIAFRAPIAEGLLGDRDEGSLVIWAALLGAATLVFRLASIIIWFERRPTAFLACELSRPALGLVAVVALLAGGGGIESVLIGTAAGAVAAAIVGLVVLRASFEVTFDRREAGPILQRGMIRAPIMMSFWTIANADVFVLSRFVDNSELGIYTLASRFGFMAAFLPQGFRLALRPLRKAAIYKSVEEQYGRAEQRGQLLGYFVLLCIGAVVAMVLLAPLAVAVAPDSFSDAAPLIPLTAAGMVLPALLRTVNQQTSWPGRTRRTFIACAITGALVFIGATILLAPEIGNYAPPLGMIAGLMPPCAYLFIRSQRGPDRISFPYREVGTALALGAVIGGGYAALPSVPLGAEIVVALVAAALFLGGLVVFRVVPEAHWAALTHMVRSLVSGRPDRFQPRRGLRALEQPQRDALRAAVQASWATGAGRDTAGGPGVETGEALVRCLRFAGNEGGVQLSEPTELDDRIGAYLFSAEPTAVRNATMRKLLGEGAEPADLRALEDLVAHLATVPEGAWAGRRKKAD